MRTFSFYLVLSALAAIYSPPAQAGPILYDPATQFDAAQNPGQNGPWSYGAQASLGGTFQLLSQTSTTGPVQFWFTQDLAPLSISHNTSSDSFGSGTVAWSGNQMLLHPMANYFAVLRFTAPSAGEYSVAARFSGNDAAVATSTDVHLLVNNVSIVDDYVNTMWSITGPGGGPNFVRLVTLQAGGTIDFVVGSGGNGHGFDSTGLVALVSGNDAVDTPEPSTMVLGSLGVMSLLGFRFRRGRLESCRSGSSADRSSIANPQA